jgi:acetoin utilization protein AcuB
MLTVADLMTLEPDVVTPDTSLLEVFERMKAEGCRQFPVLDQDGQLVGIITDRDLRLAMNSPLVLHARSEDLLLLGAANVGAVMTPHPVTVSPDTPACQAARMLSTYKFGALPVLEGDEVVGIVSVTDFLEYFADCFGEEADELANSGEAAWSSPASQEGER